MGRNDLTPNQKIALELLADADAACDDDTQHFVPVVAVVFALRDLSIHALILNQSVETTSGLVSMAAVHVDGEFFDRKGNIGKHKIAKAAASRHGRKGRVKLVGEGQLIDPVDTASVSGYDQVEKTMRKIDALRPVLVSMAACRIIDANSAASLPGSPGRRSMRL